MRYSISYWFDIAGSSCGGTEDVCAKSPEEAEDKVRAMHPNAKLRIHVVREREGLYAGRKIVTQAVRESVRELGRRR